MNAQRLPWPVPFVLFLFCLMSVSSYSQSGIQMKLQLMPDGGSWGVYAKPVGVSLSDFTITGSGQVVVVSPVGYELSESISENGNWKLSSSFDWESPNPDRRYSFYNLMGPDPLYPVQFQGEEEILLFRFSGMGTCPDSIYLVDCHTGNPTHTCCPDHPDWIPSTNDGSFCEWGTLGNELSVYDLSNGQIYGFENNYAPTAWNCHDCDGDGIPNALEDDDPGCPFREKVKIKLLYNSFDEAWNVIIVPDENFVPTGPGELLSGRLTIVASSDFEPGDILSFAGGEWTPTAQVLDVPENPGMGYFTFELQPDGLPFELEAGKETKLFRFENSLGLCPDSLFLLGGFRPSGIMENELSGMSMEVNEEVEFVLGETHGLNGWVCELVIGGGFPFENGADSLGTGGHDETAFSKNKNKQYFTLAPNPASGFIWVNFSTENIENQSFVRLMNIHGQAVQSHLAKGQNPLHIDLTNVPSGLYFLTYEERGKVLHREKLIKK